MNKNERYRGVVFWGEVGEPVLEDKDLLGRIKAPGKASLSKLAFRLYKFHDDFGLEWASKKKKSMLREGMRAGVKETSVKAGLNLCYNYPPGNGPVVLYHKE